MASGMNTSLAAPRPRPGTCGVTETLAVGAAVQEGHVVHTCAARSSLGRCCGEPGRAQVRGLEGGWGQADAAAPGPKPSLSGVIILKSYTINCKHLFTVSV